MSALDKLNKLILNSKYVSEKDKSDYRNKIKLENPMKDFLEGFKKHENNDVYKK
ncbi:MAG: hypothetical protein IPL26_12730 [Leptospiraceae bacterium]|nr:hypothetical protein [Leptospiraceae bacterium]